MDEQAQTLDPQEMNFLHHIKKELSLDTVHDAVKLVAGVLQALRQTLTLENATTLVNQLPDFLKLLFTTNWGRDEKQVIVEHLDEFVCLVMDRDKEHHKNLFKDEVQTLSVIIITLKNLYKLVDLETFEGLSNTLRQELKEVPTEAAA